jgi:hypothetical protein
LKMFFPFSESLRKFLLWCLESNLSFTKGFSRLFKNYCDKMP